jgi:hypothetical protein
MPKSRVAVYLHQHCGKYAGSGHTILDFYWRSVLRRIDMPLGERLHLTGTGELSEPRPGARAVAGVVLGRRHGGRAIHMRDSMQTRIVDIGAPGVDCR